MKDNGFVVLNVGDRGVNITLGWLAKQCDEHRPNIIEMTSQQIDYISPYGGDWSYYRGIPIRVVESGMFGIYIKHGILWRIKHKLVSKITALYKRLLKFNVKDDIK